MLQGDSYPLPTQTASYFIVYSCVAFAFAGVAKPCYFPIFHVSANDLRVACQDIKWDFCLGNMEFSYEI